jgi:hypothetical protein
MGPNDGWSAKPRAVLASNFQQVMIVDADVVWFRDPTLLFDGTEFVESGTLFFYDRRVLLESSQSQRDWLGTWMNLNSETLKRNRNHMRLGKNYYEMESGVVLVDVERHFKSVLAVIRLNTGDVSRKAYTMSHGDKETWWMAWEMMNSTYLMNQLPCGTMGQSWKLNVGEWQAYLGTTPWEWIDFANTNAWVYPSGRNGDYYRVCGSLLIHPYIIDGNIVPFWANAGPTRNKHDPHALFMSPDAWVLERDVDISPTGARFVPNAWILDEPVGYCLHVANEPSDLTRIHWLDEDEHTLKLIPRLEKLWKAL